MLPTLCQLSGGHVPPIKLPRSMRIEGEKGTTEEKGVTDGVHPSRERRRSTPSWSCGDRGALSESPQIQKGKETTARKGLGG